MGLVTLSTIIILVSQWLDILRNLDILGKYETQQH